MYGPLLDGADICNSIAASVAAFAVYWAWVKVLVGGTHAPTAVVPIVVGGVLPNVPVPETLANSVEFCAEKSTFAIDTVAPSASHEA